MDIILGNERKRWSEDQKREIVAETLSPGETVTGVARRHGANPSMVFAWRKRLLKELRPDEDPPVFMPIALAPPTADEPPSDSAPVPPMIDVTFACGARLQASGAVDPNLVTGIVRALTRV